MSAQTLSLAPINDTDVNFRLWGKAISDQLAAGGWSKVDNNINWTTVTKPGAGSTVVGYEIWSSNDAGGGLHDIFLKIEYGSGTAANNPQLWVTFGWAHSAGNLSGNTTTRTGLGGGASSASTANCYLAAGAGWISIVMFTTVANVAFGFSVERTKSAALTDQDEILALTAYVTNGAKSQVLNYASGAYPQESSPIAQAAINNTNGIQSGLTGIDLQFGQKGGLTNPSRNWFGGTTANVGAAGSTFTLMSYGVTHTYIVCANNVYFANIASQVRQILARYE